MNQSLSLERGVVASSLKRVSLALPGEAAALSKAPLRSGCSPFRTKERKSSLLRSLSDSSSLDFRSPFGRRRESPRF
ncbi:hypothetical protein B6U83_00925 [Thermoplasmatales archaeon ex4484_36]|nr:MAG: hypothetical protein B6U83_00925 [Thermoplasmatales archaeon ex4484_36]